MSFLFTLDEDRLPDQLPAIYAKYETYVEQAEPLFKLEGMRLEKMVRDIPHHQAFYGQAASDMKQLIKWLENWKSKLEAKFTKNYNGGQRVLGAREQAIFISGEKDIVEINELIIEATLLYQKLDEIKEAFVQMGFCMTNIVKLRVAELNDIVL